MEVLEAIARRRSTNSYASTPVAQETLLKLIDVSRSAPSGANKNPCRYVLITRRESLDHLGQTARTCQWLTSAQAGIAVVVDPTSSRYWLEDSCVAACVIWLAATDMGLGAAWAAMHLSDDAAESTRRQAIVREVLSIPAELSVPIVLGLGYPAADPRPRTVTELDEIVSWDRYAPSAAAP